MNDQIKRIIAAAILLVVAILSITVFSDIAADPATYGKIIQSIDERKATVMGVTAAVAAASTGVAMIPGDATTPIANQLLEMGSYLFIVVCVLFLEKVLIAIFGGLSIGVFIPAFCVLFGISLFYKKETFRVWAWKTLIFAIALIMVIPVSVKIGNMIYETHEETIEMVSDYEETEESETSKEKGWLGTMLDKVKTGVSDGVEKAKEILNRFIDAIAVFVVACCLVPIAVVFVMAWIVKVLFGITVPTPKLKGVATQLTTTVKKNGKEIEVEV